jgi:uncharacterized membrane protein
MQKTNFAAVTVVWVILMIATGMSLTMRDVHFPGYLPITVLSVGLFLVALVKVRFVILYFMELRNAPLALRLAGEAWVVLVGTGMIGMYLLR